MSETVVLVLLLLLPALIGAQLSSRARRVCFVGGLFLALCLLFVIPNGSGDSPINLLAATFFVGVALGAGVVEGFTLLSRVKQGSLHG